MKKIFIIFISILSLSFFSCATTNVADDMHDSETAATGLDNTEQEMTEEESPTAHPAGSDEFSEQTDAVTVAEEKEDIFPVPEDIIEPEIITLEPEDIPEPEEPVITVEEKPKFEPVSKEDTLPVYESEKSGEKKANADTNKSSSEIDKNKTTAPVKKVADNKLKTPAKPVSKQPAEERISN